MIMDDDDDEDDDDDDDDDVNVVNRSFRGHVAWRGGGKVSTTQLGRR